MAARACGVELMPSIETTGFPGTMRTSAKVITTTSAATVTACTSAATPRERATRASRRDARRAAPKRRPASATALTGRPADDHAQKRAAAASTRGDIDEGAARNVDLRWRQTRRPDERFVC